MGYGGIEEVEIDEEHGFFYVNRGVYWNRYKIKDERPFLDWIIQHKETRDNFSIKGDIPITKLSSPEEPIQNDDFIGFDDNPNEDFGKWNW